MVQRELKDIMHHARKEVMEVIEYSDETTYLGQDGEPVDYSDFIDDLLMDMDSPLGLNLVRYLQRRNGTHGHAEAREE